MTFWLKKFVAFWLMPLPLCLTLLVAGWWLTRRGRPSRAGRALLSAGIALLLLFSNKPFSTWFVAPLERHFPPVPELAPGQPAPAPLAACRAVVVLGSGHGDDPHLAATDKLSPPALARIVEAVRVLSVLPRARLIVSGPGVGPFPSHAAVLARAAESLGVDARRIELIDWARDTEEESKAVRTLAGTGPVALVTTAAHMPRAAYLFRTAGISFVPCPTDFMVKPGGQFQWTNLTWDVDSLDRSTWAVHERLGLYWLHLRGWFR
jgi:uncharacterized SAM-binding protein YcdF (DUF218 family)